MRKIHIIVLYILATLPLSGCFKFSKDVDKVTLLFPNLYYETSWDISYGVSIWPLIIVNNIAEPPLRLDESGNFQPGIFKKWTFLNNRKTLRVELSDSYRFHDNSRINSSDVYHSLIGTLKGKVTAHSNLYRTFCDKDKNTCPGVSLENGILTLEMNRFQNGLLRMLAVPEFGIAPKSYFDSANKKNLLGNLSGPYKVLEFEESLMQLELNKSHPFVRQDSISRINIREINSLDERIEFFRKNANSVIMSFNYKSGLRILKENGEKSITKPYVAEFMVPNITSKYLDTTDKRKRIFSIIRLVKSKLELNERVAKVTDQLFWRDNIAYLKSISADKYLPSPEPFDKPLSLKIVSFINNKGNPILTQLQGLLKSFNINLQIEYVGAKEIFQYAARKKAFDFIYLTSGIGVQDPLIEYSYMYNRSVSSRLIRSSTSKLLMKQIRQEPSREKYISLVKKLHSHLLYDYRLLPVVHLNVVYASNGNFEIDTKKFGSGIDFWKWRTK